MTTKPSAPLIAPPKKPVRSSTKGEPPVSGNTGAAVGNHTQKPESNDVVDFNMRVPASFKIAVDTFMAANGLKRKTYIMQLIKQDMESKGWETNH